MSFQGRKVFDDAWLRLTQHVRLFLPIGSFQLWSVACLLFEPKLGPS